MPVNRKRKYTAVEDQQSSKQTKTTKIQKNIHSFGSVGKRPQVYVDGKTQKSSVVLDNAPPKTRTPANVAVENKRKRDAVSDNEEEIVAATRSDTAQPATDRQIASTPRNKRFKNVAPPTPAETPTKGALALFDRLNIDGNSRAIPCALPKKKHSIYDTPPDTPIHEKGEPHLALPVELHDLLDLHSSFLSSLSLYYSHNGSTSPVNIAALLPMITKHWKRRDVNIDDLRRLLAVGNAQSHEFSIQDYGRAGTCVSRSYSDERSAQRAASYIDEQKLNGQFEASLLKAWSNWQAEAPQENSHANTFLAQMPLVEIAMNDSVQKAAPVFARGQQRLADMKASKTAAKSSSQAPQAQPSTQGTQNRGTALLDRILAKQSMASKLPSGPTKEQLERRSALQRIEDVSKVLSLLAGTKERCSFSMPVITQHLQQSLRNPISREEVERCLGLMSTEVLPGFVKVVQSGEVKGVVIARSANVGLAELRARVEQACD